MQNIRRWYVYLITAISLNGVTWAVIGLLRSLFAPGITREFTGLALNIAIIVIGLPVYLIHWVWAQRLARVDREEHSSVLRHAYLYIALAATLGPILGNSFYLLIGRASRGFEGYSFHLIAIVVLAVIFAYHYRVLEEGRRTTPERGERATVRRLFIFGFSLAGLWMLLQAAINILRVLINILLPAASGRITQVELVRLILGGLVWLFFWTWAQRLFVKEEEERNSAFRKFYLYLVVFITSIGAVGGATTVLAGLFRRLLDLPASGGGSTAISIIIGMSVAWAYHAYVLRKDAAAAADQPRQAGIRRTYQYLIAGIGLTAFLVGLAGDINVALTAFGGTQFLSSQSLRESLAWNTAATLVGLILWALSWRNLEAEVAGTSEMVKEARRSTARKAYLYIFLFAASVTILGTLISVLYQLLLVFFGERTMAGFLLDVASPLSYAVIAAVVLGYHGSILRRDGRAESDERALRIGKECLAIVESPGSKLATELKRSLAAEFPKLQVEIAGFATAAKARASTALLKRATLIVVPSNALAVKRLHPALSAALVGSSPQKLFVPMDRAGWNWAGVHDLETEKQIEHTLRSVRQLLLGEKIKTSKSVGCGAWAVIGIVVFFLLLFVLSRFLYF